MSKLVLSTLAAALAAGLCGSPVQCARAAVTVFGDGLSKDCEAGARAVSSGKAADPHALAACDQALDFEGMSLHDLAGTHINRGVILLSRTEYAKAKQDFDQAALLMPDIGESYTDLGAALIGLGRYAEGKAEIDHGLTLGTVEPEKAYFNRALADEGLDDMKSAYFDYLHALELKPKWKEPKDQLARFTVAKVSS